MANESEKLWQEDKARYGWELPKPAAKFYRLPIVRGFRAAYLDYRVRRHAYAFNRAGIGFGGPSQYDLWVLYAIARGWC